MIVVTEQEVKRRIKGAIKEFGSQIAFAKALGISGAYVSAVLKGDKVPRGRILEFLGIEAHTQTVTFYTANR